MNRDFCDKKGIDFDPIVLEMKASFNNYYHEISTRYEGFAERYKTSNSGILASKIEKYKQLLKDFISFLTENKNLDDSIVHYFLTL